MNIKKKESFHSQENKPLHQSADTKNNPKKLFNPKGSLDKTASKCYMLNDASLGIHCTRIPKSMEANDVINFFNVYGEIDSIGYIPKKRTCDIIYYDIRSSIAAYIALQNYSFDKNHILHLNFMSFDLLEKLQKTSFAILKLVNTSNTFVPKDEVEQFARTYGDFHNVEPTLSGGYIIYFYDSRQCNQCISRSNIEFNNQFKYVIYPHFDYLNKPVAESLLNQKHDFINQILTTRLDEFNDKLENSLNNQDVQIYKPAQGQHNNYHSRLFMTLFNKQALKDSVDKPFFTT